jgi:hypothetical protein
LTAITQKSAIFGHLVSFFTCFCPDNYRLTVTQNLKFMEKLKRESIDNQKIVLIIVGIYWLKCYQLTQKLDLVRLSATSTHGSLKCKLLLMQKFKILKYKNQSFLVLKLSKANHN